MKPPRMLLLPFFAGIASALQTLPPTEWQSSTPGGFSVWGVEKNIYIDKRFAYQRDQNGLTLIPPSAHEFANTFKRDLEEITGDRWRVHPVQEIPKDATGIFLEGFEGKDLTYENGKPTEEGYELQVENDKVTIRGSGSRGMWWGTRTLLQQILLAGDSTIPTGKTLDAPAYPTRGFMLDAGRKWYSPDYLKDLCTYASFFKMSEFHYHATDNAPLSRGHNETWQDVYSQWALRPNSPDLQPLVQRRNETLSQADFEDFQHHCAQRGVTVIPEIEAPGHCLTITKWKPELALDQQDLLNLTHPEAIPLIKSIWKEYLPWFKTKEVHIGADEYDSTLADVYIKFVNEMAEYIKSISDKHVRIWGTYEPSETETIASDVITQHWQYGQSDPVELANQGYEIINSEDWWAYMSLKNDHMPILPAPYPPFFNNTRVLNFANKQGWQWEPSLFNPVNVTEQPDAKTVRGALLAAWNDNGPDATTQLEAYYAIRNGIPVVAARSWTGKRGPKLDESNLSSSIDLLTSHAVGQNLDRRIAPQKCDEFFPLVQWSQNGRHHGRQFKGDHIGYDSKGMNYTLELEVNGPFVLSSRDDSLTLSHDGTLTFNSDGWQYPLRSVSETAGFDVGFPGRIWTNDTNSSHEVVKVPHNSRITIRTDVIGGSRVWVDGKFVGRFEVFVFGGKNTYFSWSQMAMVAPLERLEGHGLKWLTVHGYDGKHNYTSSD